MPSEPHAGAPPKGGVPARGSQVHAAATGDVATSFTAMACPCLVLVDTADRPLGSSIGRAVMREAQRIEAKFSRYRPSALTDINQSAGADIRVDDETADLLDYGARCHLLSEGRFDLSSGALRRVWTYKAGARVPSQEAVDAVLAHVGWSRVSWNRPLLRLPAGMELDFGGIGKEYAVDRALDAALKAGSPPLLINFGGDLRVSGPRANGEPWQVGIEDVDAAGKSAGRLTLKHGALATSGDAQRVLIHNGIRYGHVLDPRTGWPVPDSPRSITVHADTCSEAGLLAKLALLRGAEAESFLRAEQIRAWCMR